MKDKEIELKFVINNKIKDKIICDLQNKTIKSYELRLIDTYYIPNFKDFEINGETIECVRIRENKDTATLTYKKIHKDANPIYCDEYETIVSSKEQMEKILFALGFKIQMIIDKTRLSIITKDFEFDFDSVKNLGELLEVELLNKDRDIETIYDEISKYGLSKNDVTYEGIQTMMKNINNM